MNIEEIERKLQHEVLSRFSKTSDKVSQEPLNDSLGETGELVSQLISGWLNTDEETVNTYQIEETLILQFKQTHPLILKLAGVVVWSSREGDDLKGSPFHLYFTLDRRELAFYSYGLYFDDESKGGVPYESGKALELSVDTEWKHQWQRNFND